jgi:predicted amidohydrolase
MRRTALILAALAALTTLPGVAAEVAFKTTSNLPPRKVIVGTSMQAYWVTYPGLQKRLEQLTGMIDRMAEQSQAKYGRGLDLAVLPEAAVNGEVSRPSDAIPFEGPVKEAFARTARQHHCYIVVPMYLQGDKARNISYNVAILVGRNGEVVGTYKKVHLAVVTGRDKVEGDMTPGKEFPVFDCDFGKLGLQICFDMDFDAGWKELARKGADLVAWPTQSPQTAQPASRAMLNRYYIVSSTWRNNASIFEPTGKIVSQIRAPEQTLVQELDLSYAILPWSTELANGAAFKRKFGDKVGFRYYEDEDLGIFWSNDPKVPIRQMVLSIPTLEVDEELPRARRYFDKLGVPRF